jgi:hypothetical protein
VTVETPPVSAATGEVQDAVMQPAAGPEPAEYPLATVSRTGESPAAAPVAEPAPPVPRRARPGRSRRIADALWLLAVASGLLAAAAFFGTGWLTEPLGHDTAPESLRATGEMPAPAPPAPPEAPATEPAPVVVPAPAVERPAESPIQMVRVSVPSPSGVWPGLDADADGPRFYASRTEVTRGQWAAMLGDPAPGVGEDGHPVTRVSLWDAVRYANALSKSAGLAACYTCEDETCAGATLASARCDGFRVPTMAEWRAVSGAGWGPAPPTEGRAIFAKSGLYEPAEPCEAGPDGNGICDVYGNVLEWVWGGARGLAFRIGGSFAHPEGIAGQKVAFRPGHRSPYGGIRLVRTVEGPRTRYGAWMHDAADGRFLTPNGTAVRPEADTGWALAVLATAAAPVEGTALAGRLMVPPDDLWAILKRLDLELDRVDAGWGIARMVDERVALVERAAGAAPEPGATDAAADGPGE